MPISQPILCEEVYKAWTEAVSTTLPSYELEVPISSDQSTTTAPPHSIIVPSMNTPDWCFQCLTQTPGQHLIAHGPHSLLVATQNMVCLWPFTTTEGGSTTTMKDIPLNVLQLCPSHRFICGIAINESENLVAILTREIISPSSTTTPIRVQIQLCVYSCREWFIPHSLLQPAVGLFYESTFYGQDQEQFIMTWHSSELKLAVCGSETGILRVWNLSSQSNILMHKVQLRPLTVHSITSSPSQQRRDIHKASSLSTTRFTSDPILSLEWINMTTGGNGGQQQEEDSSEEVLSLSSFDEDMTSSSSSVCPNTALAVLTKNQSLIVTESSRSGDLLVLTTGIGSSIHHPPPSSFHRFQSSDIPYTECHAIHPETSEQVSLISDCHLVLPGKFDPIECNALIRSVYWLSLSLIVVSLANNQVWLLVR